MIRLIIDVACNFYTVLGSPVFEMYDYLVIVPHEWNAWGNFRVHDLKFDSRCKLRLDGYIKEIYLKKMSVGDHDVLRSHFYNNLFLSKKFYEW